MTHPESLGEVTLSHSRVTVGPGISLHCAEAGERVPDYNNIVLLLHGFPDFWYTWRAQIPALVNAGYFVVAPDLRGYAASDKPFALEEYGADAVTSDIEAIRHHYCGQEPFALLAGHDWGATIVWAAIQRYPTIAVRAATLNVPHPVTFAEGLSAPPQLLKSAYIFAFQVPWLPELFLGSPLARWALMLELEASASFRSSLAATREGFKGPEEVPGLSEKDRKWYDIAIRTEGAVRGGLSYYRASAAGLWPGFLPAWVPDFGPRILRWLHGSCASADVLLSERSSDSPFSKSAHAPSEVNIPVLVLWGVYDHYLDKALATPPLELVPNLHGPVFLNGTHWVHHSQPQAVNDELVQFLKSNVAQPEGVEDSCAS